MADFERFGPEVVLDRPAFVHPTALAYGRVRIGEGASIWPHAVMRAEAEEVVVGPMSNVQDFAMLHVGRGAPTIIGAYCSITHHATVHGATIGDDTLIGINATLMDGVVVGSRCIVAGGAFLPEDMQVPDDSVVMGMPARVVARRNCFRQTRRNALVYHRNALAYARGDHRAWSGEDYDTWLSRTDAEIDEEFRRRFPSEAGPSEADKETS